MIVGQGIPDPWLTRSHSDKLEFPFAQRTHSENVNIRKNIFQYLRGESYNGNFRDKPCFCCEKKFLFDCPDNVHPVVQNATDKTNLLNCPCLECHGKEKTTPIVCSQHCNCVPIIQNWMFEHHESRNRKNFEKKKRIPSDLSSDLSSKYNADEESSTESLCPSNYLMRYCSCLQNKHKNIYLDYYNVGMPYRLRSRGLQKGIFTNHTANKQCNRYVKSLLCPCLVNFKCTRRESQNKSQDTNLRSSKEVQTDDQPLRESKIIQTDKTKATKCKTDQSEQRCSCDVKWAGSNVIHCDSSNPIFNPQAGQRFTMCFSHPSLVCHYPHSSQLLIHHADHKRKCKKVKRRNCEVDKASQCNLLPTYVREEVDSPMRTKPKEVLEFKNYLTRPGRDLSSCRPTIEPFDYSKYLAEKRVKEFFQEREFPSERKFDFRRKTYGMALKRLEDERRLQGGKPNGRETEVFKPSSLHKNHIFESLPQETLKDSFRKDESHDLNSSIPISTRKNPQIENFKKESPVEINFLKHLDSRESRTYGLVGHCKSSCSQMRKRKKVNRKGRRKPLRVIYSRLERPPNLSSKPPINHEPTNNKADQIENQRDEGSLKTLENNQKSLRRKKANDLKFVSTEENFPSQKIVRTFTGTKAGIGQETISRHHEWYDQRNLLETFKEPLKSKVNFNNILHQISSHNSGTTWSSDTLKNIVDELILGRKTFE